MDFGQFRFRTRFCVEEFEIRAVDPDYLVGETENGHTLVRHTKSIARTLQQPILLESRDDALRRAVDRRVSQRLSHNLAGRCVSLLLLVDALNTLQ